MSCTRMNAERCNLLDVMQHFGNGQRIGGIDERMPMIGHQDIPAKEKLQTFAGFLDHFNEQRVFIGMEGFYPGPQVHVDEEKPIGKEQAVNVGHRRRISLLVIY